MAVINDHGTIIITGEADIRNARLMTLKGALKLEMAGMHRRGRSAYTILKQDFGYRGSRATVLAAVQRDVDALTGR